MLIEISRYASGTTMPLASGDNIRVTVLEEGKSHIYDAAIDGISMAEPSRWPLSPWECIRARWIDGNETSTVSPWDVVPHDDLPSSIIPKLPTRLQTAMRQDFPKSQQAFL